MRRSFSATPANFSIKQLRCFLCSVCLFVMCVLVSSFFITSSLTNNRAPLLTPLLNYRLKRTLPRNYSVQLGDEGAMSPLRTTLSPAMTMTATTSTVKSRDRRVPIRLEAPHSRQTATPPVSTSKSVTVATNHTASLHFRRVQEQCHEAGIKRTIHDDFKYLINEESLCSGLVYLVVAVHSKPSYRSRRDLIRQTWGSIRHYDGQRIKVVFFLAKINSPRATEEVRNESRANRDIIQRDFIDHYRNLTRKHLTVMRWVSDHCSHASYLVKVDDDTFINIFHLIQMLKAMSPQNFMCKVVTGAPIRSAHSLYRKWRVTREEYPQKRYPHYCEGFAYLLRANLTRDFYWCSQFTKFFWIDDVFISGILANKLNVSRDSLWRGHAWVENTPSLASEKIMDYVFVRTGSNQIMPSLWMSFWRACLSYSH